MNQPATKPDHAEIRGLCANCNNRGKCLNFQTRGAVWHCNEHDTYNGNLAAAAVPLRRSVESPPAQPEASGARADGFKGLCINCDNRHDCRLPRSDYGVWHCEEYR